MNNGPALWQELLKYAPKGSALMGGAVVDFMFGHEAKDYDIFTSHTNEVGVLRPGNWEYTPPENKDARLAEYDIEDKEGNNPIFSVENYAVTLGGVIHKVQFIVVGYEDVLEYTKHFDHSLTLGVYGRSGLKVSSRVFNSMQNKTVELLNNKKPDKSLARAQRKVAKLDPEGANTWTYKGWN